jgi:hypothetical protein
VFLSGNGIAIKFSCTIKVLSLPPFDRLKANGFQTSLGRINNGLSGFIPYICGTNKVQLNTVAAILAIG